MRKIYIDCESYFSRKDKYDLKSISVTEYIRDPRFKLFGCGFYQLGETNQWIYSWVSDFQLLALSNVTTYWGDCVFIGHNIKFDGAILAWKYGIKPAKYFCTQALSRAVIGQNIASYSLKSVSEYLGLPPKGELKWDGVRDLTPEQEAEMIEYNRRDLECCAGINEKIGTQFPDNQRQAMDWTIRAFVEPSLRLDTQVLEKMVSDESKRRSSIFLALGIDKECFASSIKFANILRGRKIDIPTKQSPRTGKVIPALSLQDPGFVALKASCLDLYEARVAAKSTLVETRGEKLSAVGKTGPFPFDVQFSGAIATHRYSGGNGAGGNPQNFPNKGDMRKSVIAPSGYSLVVGDFSSIEARLVAWMAKEPELIRAFSANEDVYSKFASTIYGLPVDKHKFPVERKVGKTCILGLGYGMGIDKFQARIKQDAGIEIDRDEARRIVFLYRSTYASIPILWQKATALLQQMRDGYKGVIPFAPFMSTDKNALILPSGLRIQYPNLRQDPETGEWMYDVYKKRYDKEPVKLYGGKIIENICQAVAGEICKIAIQRYEARGYKVVGAVHDEILGIVRHSEATKATNELRDCMQQPIEWWPVLKLAAEVGYGPNWKEAKA